MPQIDKQISETDLRNKSSTYWSIRADATDDREWLANAPICEALSHYHISHLGYAIARPPFRIVRAHLQGSYFLTSYTSNGRVLVDGRFKPVKSGQAFLLPPGTMHAFHSVKSGSADGNWAFSWVRYREVPGQTPIAAANSPILADFDGVSFKHAILGLHHDCQENTHPANQRRWIEIIHQCVIDFAQPAKMDERLWKLFQKIENSLAAEWSCPAMAEECHIGEKQLERLCVRELGRTPRQHLIWLRMQRAAELLTSGEAKIASVAHAVGYQNAFVFSSTFKRVMGWSPSEYPGRK
ncbi:AraC family transcriptional regulator [Telmatocola sphagniphila]|uniref:AraC family transcriptional regulator n=1 Tax=Telmatocola sphagniphila TaxID=1123043 RepID=A0A8E6ETG2_9BACT|nr:AraC family transcriptional regulator [Telmatocola sphagniphila]QVL32404.1 AraC family transcriptional regulator [Telmatocola sphagniphila]